MRDVLFYERQSFHPIFYLIAIGLGLFGLAMLIPTPGDGRAIEPAAGFVGFFFLLAAVVIVNALTMTTWVYNDEICVYFGRLIPYYKKRIRLEEISSCRETEYRPIRRSGGWGIRMGKFEGKTTGFLSARGRNGILIVTPERPYIIGTQYSAKLAQALEEASQTPSQGKGTQSTSVS